MIVAGTKQTSSNIAIWRLSISMVPLISLHFLDVYGLMRIRFDKKRNFDETVSNCCENLGETCSNVFKSFIGILNVVVLISGTFLSRECFVHTKL